MSNPASLQPRDIVILRREIVEGQEIKTRMWVVISKNVLHQNSKGCIILGITTYPANNFTMMKIGSSDLESGKLDKPTESKVVIDKPVWIEHAKINAVVGKVTTQFYDSLKLNIKNNILEI